ncbi:MAG: methylglyoxal synthase [Oscillospiraceae bacterium]|jgi:methylglyoxal synthase|nr:methylglyoxal synthase [Oscillospiraceae bacterium]
MNIALIARERKKELMIRFCIAYKSILSKHNLFATAGTARIAKTSELDLVAFLSGTLGGYHQISSKISCGEIDVVFFFRDAHSNSYVDQGEIELLKNCDFCNIPLATNIATAEVLVRGIENGSLDWRNLANQKLRSF